MNRLTVDQLVNVLLSIDKAHTAPHRAMECGLDQVYEPNHPLSLLRVSVASITTSLPDV